MKKNEIQLFSETKAYIRQFDSIKDVKYSPLVVTSANWNESDNTGRIARAMRFLLQNQRQFWTPEEIALTRDIRTWNKLTKAEKRTYIRVLGGLTMLDTLQGDVGMPSIIDVVDNHYDKAVLTFMAAMENSVHARSYSNIFSTLASQEENKEVFEWLNEDKFIQAKANIIKAYYNAIDPDDEFSIMLGMFASGMLESFLFYSGFYYPLYFKGKGMVTGSGEIIRLIVRDESIHGVFVGELFKDRYMKLNKQDKERMSELCHQMMFDLFENEVDYTHYLYDDVGETGRVIEFLKYNANKALMNFGFDKYYEHEEINPIVTRALSGSSHDFFSAKGDSYMAAIVEQIQPSDFKFDLIVTQESNAPDELIPIE